MKLFKPKNKTLILEPSISKARGTIVVPDIYSSGTSMCKVIDAGDKVNPLIKKGMVVLCQNGFGERKNCIIDNTNQFMCYEENIFAVMMNRQIKPLGRTVLIKRLMSETTERGIITRLDNRSYQSMDGLVLRLGLTRQHFKVNGISPGDRITLEGWQPHWVEIELEDRSYGLIVNETDLLYKHDDN